LRISSLSLSFFSSGWRIRRAWHEQGISMRGLGRQLSVSGSQLTFHGLCVGDIDNGIVVSPPCKLGRSKHRPSRHRLTSPANVSSSYRVSAGRHPIKARRVLARHTRHPRLRSIRCGLPKGPPSAGGFPIRRMRRSLHLVHHNLRSTPILRSRLPRPTLVVPAPTSTETPMNSARTSLNGLKILHSTLTKRLLGPTSGRPSKATNLDLLAKPNRTSLFRQKDQRE
jgi:hypothetical protein